MATQELNEEQEVIQKITESWLSLAICKIGKCLVLKRNTFLPRITTPLEKACQAPKL